MDVSINASRASSAKIIQQDGVAQTVTLKLKVTANTKLFGVKRLTNNINQS